MRNLLLFSILCSLPLFGQQRQPVSSLQPDCMVTANFTAASSGAQAAGTVTAGSTGTTSVIDNRTDAGCLDWLVTYSTTTTVTALSLLFQTATNLAGVPGTWSAYGGTLSSGINPNTAATPPWAITDATGSKYPFLRLNLTSLTVIGTGTVSVNLYGWKRRPTYVTVTAGGGCPGTIATPCVVVGPTAAGAAPTTSPVLVAGENGAPGTVQTLRLDSAGLTPIAISAPGTSMANALAYPTTPTGSQSSAPMATGPHLLNPTSGNLDQQPGTLAGGAFVQGPAAESAALTGNPVRVGGQDVITPGGGAGVNIKTIGVNAFGGVVSASVGVNAADGLSNTLVQNRVIDNAGAINVVTVKNAPYTFNGSTWDRQYICTLKASVTLSDGTVTKIVAESGSTIIRVCHIHMSTTTAETFTISQGTGAACVTGLTTIDKYITTQTLAMDFQPTAALRTSAAAGLCVSQSGTQAAEVTVIYAQF